MYKIVSSVRSLTMCTIGTVVDTAQPVSTARHCPPSQPPATAFKDNIWRCILELSMQDPYSPSQNGPLSVRLCDLGLTADAGDMHMHCCGDHVTGVIYEQRLYLQKCDFIKKLPDSLRNILGPIDRKFLRTECTDPGRTHNLCNVNLEDLVPLSHVSLGGKRGTVYVNAIGALKAIHSQLIDILISDPHNA